MTVKLNKGYANIENTDQIYSVIIYYGVFINAVRAYLCDDYRQYLQTFRFDSQRSLLGAAVENSGNEYSAAAVFHHPHQHSDQCAAAVRPAIV